MDLASRPELSHVISVPLDLVREDGNDMRRTKADARADAALTSSIRRRGVLQAIGVRPNGNGYRLVFGRRRLRCARAAGLTEIPADVRDWQDAEIRAVQGAENMQRLQVHPIDKWLTVRDLVDEGYSIADAAEELGLDERTARQMDRLGNLAPELIKLAEIEMPGGLNLRVIANAPAATQKNAAKGKLVVRSPSGRESVLWHEVAERCKVKRISQAHAIFNVQAHPAMWEEDLFAEPDDADRIGTRDLSKFMKLQQAALAARVEAARTAKKRVQLAEYSAAAGYPGVALPKGWRQESGHAPQGGFKPKKVECVFTAVHPDGRILEVLAVDVAAKKAADRTAADRDKAKATPAKTAVQTEDESEHDADDATADDAGDDAADAPAIAAKPGILKAGLKAIAEEKTRALQATLREGIADLPLERVIALLLLAFTADNVQVRSHWEHLLEWDDHARRDFRDIKRALLQPGGGLAEISAADARMQAGEMLARLLAVGGPDDAGRSYSTASGAAAEWIGMAIGAGAAVGRFDNADFLKQAGGDELRRAATAAGIKATGAVTALRARLVGNLPNWRPDAAQFGAPGPAA